MSLCLSELADTGWTLLEQLYSMGRSSLWDQQASLEGSFQDDGRSTGEQVQLYKCFFRPWLLCTCKPPIGQKPRAKDASSAPGDEERRECFWTVISLTTSIYSVFVANHVSILLFGGQFCFQRSLKSKKLKFSWNQKTNFCKHSWGYFQVSMTSLRLKMKRWSEKNGFLVGIPPMFRLYLRTPGKPSKTLELSLATDPRNR